MAEIVRLPARAAVEPTVAELSAQIATLTGRLAELETRLPPPRFTIPAGWVPVKQASCSFALSTVHQWARKRKITSVLIGGRRYIDPSSLPRA